MTRDKDKKARPCIESMLLNFCRQSLFNALKNMLCVKMVGRGESGKSILQEIVYGSSL